MRSKRHVCSLIIFSVIGICSSMIVDSNCFRQFVTEIWNLGHICNSFKNKDFITFSKLPYPNVNDSTLLEKALINPVCKIPKLIFGKNVPVNTCVCISITLFFCLYNRKAKASWHDSITLWACKTIIPVIYDIGIRSFSKSTIKIRVETKWIPPFK